MPDNAYPPDRLMRFSVLDRFLHLVLMFGFTGLAATGLSLGFSATAPARAFMWLVGGSDSFLRRQGQRARATWPTLSGNADGQHDGDGREGPSPECR